MNFDSVRNNVAKSIEEIARFVDVTVDPEKIPDTQVTVKQSNAINAKWKDQFISEFSQSDLSLIPQQNKFFDKIKRKIKKIKNGV